MRAVVQSVVAAVLCACLAASCAQDSAESEQAGATTTDPVMAAADDEPSGSDGDASDAVREGVDCSPEGLDDTGEFEFTTAHYVVDGRLAAVCLGAQDATLAEAWAILVDIVPPQQLADLALFGGFTGDATEEEPTLAFVNAREDTDEFQMSVNLTEAQAYPEDFTLTMVHEFAHVFTGVPTELDRTLLPQDCTTWDNGEGCYVPGSVMDAWTSEFWADELETLDPSAEASAEEGQQRCDADPGFFGAYGASHPEEDFAESFAAWVLQVPAASEAQEQRYEFLEQRPGLEEFRTRASDAGYGPQPNNFDECGLGA